MVMFLLMSVYNHENGAPSRKDTNIARKSWRFNIQYAAAGCFRSNPGSQEVAQILDLVSFACGITSCLQLLFRLRGRVAHSGSKVGSSRIQPAATQGRDVGIKSQAGVLRLVGTIDGTGLALVLFHLAGPSIFQKVNYDSHAMPFFFHISRASPKQKTPGKLGLPGAF